MKDTQDIFDYSLQEQLKEGAPLADRMRPQTLDQFVGQNHILSPGRLLRRAIQADQLSSLIFFGPPGTGKTTLARIIANTTKAQFVSLNAVLSGVKDIRAGIASAETFRKEYARKTILFIDEVHRFNKAQQDALLPHVENGTVILIGATTENPYFEVNKALVSRSRIFQLGSLEDKDLEKVLEIALKDKERGYGDKSIEIEHAAKKHLVQVANGDARALLNALELAVETSETGKDGTIFINLEIAEESIQRKAVLYDKDGDAHFDTISAFIKSMRGSDPDAALYWMAKMVYGGEDPRFLFRRMIIFASEDIGMADPKALQVVMSAAQAFDYVGMPEGRFHLAQACLYLSTAPKSNSGFAFFDALDAVQKEKNEEVPNHIKDGNRDKEGFGHGEGYMYPHAYKDHWVAQQYLPDVLQGRIFYQPSDQGYESGIKQTVIQRRETQIAALLNSSEGSGDKQHEYWQGRTLGNTAELLADIRNFVFNQISFQPYQMVLVLNAGDGVFLGEALRQVREGTIYGLVRNQQEKALLEKHFSSSDYLDRPIIDLLEVDNGKIKTAPSLLNDDTQFDIAIGRNALSKSESNLELLSTIAKVLTNDGSLFLVESIPAEGQRLSEFMAESKFNSDLMAKVRNVEQTIYGVNKDDHSSWDGKELEKQLKKAGLFPGEQQKTAFFNKTMITKNKIDQWFEIGKKTSKSFADFLAAQLSNEEIEKIKQHLHFILAGKVVRWKSSWLFVKAKKKP
ncbi:MAG: AAA family ATPase [Proteobacteria bacterium]|nr:AAA family ATPase [Pseudomonadota bacterium]